MSNKWSRLLTLPLLLLLWPLMPMRMTMMNTSRLYMIIISLNLILRLLIAQVEFSNLLA